MFRFSLITIMATCVLTGCQQDNRSNDETAFQGEVNLKPVVAVIPVIDNTKNNLDWDLSEEFTSGIYYQLAQKDDLFLAPPSKVRSSIRNLRESNDPFGSDVSWIKNAFKENEFVVFMELIQHEEIYRQDRKNPKENSRCSADLNMSMRVRIFDVRGDQPKIVLQELIRNTHFIARPFTQENFFQSSWGNASFTVSPMGFAHEQFIKEISSRLDEYILFASSK